MKKNVIILLVYILNSSLSYTQDVEMLIDSTTFDMISSLEEINTSSYAEAYPWISADGLTLYYLKCNPECHINYGKRESLNDDFSNFKELSLNTMSTYTISFWLTNNELEIYFTSNGELYYSNRNGINEAFNNPVKVNLNPDGHMYYLQPSLTQDKSELYIRCTDDAVNSIWIFSAVDETNFHLVDSLQVPSGYQPGVGQLSKYGLKYYLSIDDEYTRKIIGYYTRDSISGKFSQLYYFNSNINSGHTINIMPTISQDENVIVYQRKDQPEWSHCDLYIAQKKGSTNNRGVINSNKLTLSNSPNPFNLCTKINYSLCKPGVVELTIYYLNGKKTQTLVNSYRLAGEYEITWQPKDLSAGIYIVKLQTGEFVETKKLILEK